MGIGETAALWAAFMWTISSFLWGRIKLNAVELNICKNIMGATLISAHVGVMLLIATWSWDSASIEPSSPPPQVQPEIDLSSPSSPQLTPAPEPIQEPQESFRLMTSWTAWGWLALSGLVGILVGDTFYFRSLQILGPRRSLVVATTSPFFAIVSSWLLLSESLVGIQLLGISMTVLGVMAVVAEKKGEKEALNLFPGVQSTGVAVGIAGAICQGLGATFAKVGMAVDGCSPLEATMVRLLVAAAGSIIYLLLRRHGRQFAKKFFRWELIKQLIPAAAIGTWIGIWLSQIAFKETEVGIAQTLLATSPLFAIPIVVFFQGHRISTLAIAGTVFAILGILLTVDDRIAEELKKRWSNIRYSQPQDSDLSSVGNENRLYGSIDEPDQVPVRSSSLRHFDLHSKPHRSLVSIRNFNDLRRAETR